MSKIYYTSIMLLCAYLLASCDRQNSPESILQDYSQRVETATGIEAQALNPIELAVYPAHRDLVLPVEEVRVGLLDFFKLYDCNLFNLISERNSGMGKMMPVSRQLVYEVKFLEEAERCYRKLAENPQLNKEFQQEFLRIIEIKQHNLKAIFWNATLASPEMQKAFSLAVNPLNLGEDVAFVNSQQALEYFNRLGRQLSNPTLTINADELESQYFALQLHQYGGRLLKAINQLVDYLNRAAYSLEMLVKERPLCYQGKPIQKALILQNVLTRYYAGQAQPYVAQIHQQGRSWLQAINTLVRLQNVQIPSAFTRYQAQMLSLESQQGLWHQFEQAINRHTQAWQRLLEQCGLLPKST